MNENSKCNQSLQKIISLKTDKKSWKLTSSELWCGFNSMALIAKTWQDRSKDDTELTFMNE